MSSKATPITVSSIYGDRLMPRVELVLGEEKVTLLPEQSREIGGWLIQGAEAAVTDGFMYTYARQVLGKTDEESAGIVEMFRGYREAARVREMTIRESEDELPSGE